MYSFAQPGERRIEIVVATPALAEVTNVEIHNK
jgi:hypothetical protein